MTFPDDLIALLTSARGRSGEGLVSAMSVPILRRLSVELISAVKQRGAFQDRVLRTSSIHPTGFARVIFSVPQFSEHLRLHVWAPRYATDCSEDIHNHRWDFASMVLRGSVTEETWRYAADDQTPSKVFDGYMHTLIPSERHYKLEPTGARRLELRGVKDHHVGQIRTLSREALHRTNAREASTLLLEGPALSRTTEVYRPAGEWQQIAKTDAQRTALSLDEVVHLVEDELSTTQALER